MVTVNFEDSFRWRGEGPVSDRVRNRLADMVAARDAVNGRLIRAYENILSRLEGIPYLIGNAMTRLETGLASVQNEPNFVGHAVRKSHLGVGARFDRRAKP